MATPSEDSLAAGRAYQQQLLALLAWLEVSLRPVEGRDPHRCEILERHAGDRSVAPGLAGDFGLRELLARGEGG